MVYIGSGAPKGVTSETKNDVSYLDYRMKLFQNLVPSLELTGLWCDVTNRNTVFFAGLMLEK